MPPRLNCLNVGCLSHASDIEPYRHIHIRIRPDSTHMSHTHRPQENDQSANQLRSAAAVPRHCSFNAQYIRPNNAYTSIGRLLSGLLELTRIYDLRRRTRYVWRRYHYIRRSAAKHSVRLQQAAAVTPWSSDADRNRLLWSLHVTLFCRTTVSVGEPAIGGRSIRVYTTSTRRPAVYAKDLATSATARGDLVAVDRGMLADRHVGKRGLCWISPSMCGCQYIRTHNSQFGLLASSS